MDLNVNHHCDDRVHGQDHGVHDGYHGHGCDSRRDHDHDRARNLKIMILQLSNIKIFVS